MKKCGVIIGMAAMLVGALSGCGRSGKDELEGVYRVSATATDSDTDIGASDKMPDYERYVFYTEAGSEYSVDAEVISENCENARICEAVPLVFDDVLMDEYAKKLFDNGIYEKVKPYDICSMEELAGEEAYLSGLVQEGTVIDSLNEINNVKAAFEEDNVKNYPDGQLVYIDGERRECRLRGYVGNELWELIYVRGDGTSGLDADGNAYPNQIYSELVFRPLAEQEDVVNKCREPMGDYGDNSVDYDEACKAASDLLAELEIDNMDIAAAWQTCYAVDGGMVPEGYKLVYTKALNGVKGVYATNHQAADENSYVLQETLNVYVDNRGIRRLEYISPYVLGTVISDKVNMLGYEQIKANAESYMDFGGLLNTGSYQGEITSIEFRYVMMKYDGEYAMMPYWIYYMDNKSNERSAKIGINAVTGDFIGFNSMILKYSNYFN